MKDKYLIIISDDVFVSVHLINMTGLCFLLDYLWKGGKMTSLAMIKHLLSQIIRSLLFWSPSTVKTCQCLGSMSKSVSVHGIAKN